MTARTPAATPCRIAAPRPRAYIKDVKQVLKCCLGLLLFAGCGDAAEGAATGAKCKSADAVTYDEFVKPFMSKYCLRCHSSELPADKRNGAPLDHNFDSEEGVLDEAAHVALSAAAGPDAINTAMPPSGTKPSDEERRMLGEWLACHADTDAGE